MEINTSTWVNRSVLSWARKRLGFSEKDVEELSKNLGKFYISIEERELKQWEEGTAQPYLEELETLSEIYVCPVGYFFLETLPEEPLGLSFRGLASEKEGKLKPLSQQTLRRFLQLAKWTIHTIEQLGVEWKVSPQPPTTKLLNQSIDVETLVQQERERLGFTSEVRRTWTDTNAAFLWWRRKIEAQGIFCFQMKLEFGDIRGASTWLDSRYPFILVNHQDVETATGRMFTLLHEYCHVITAREGIVCDFRGLRPSDEPEPLANQFASRMLVSHDEVGRRLREIDEYQHKEIWSDQVLDEIRKPFFVSRDVVAIMLQEMDLAPGDFYQRKRIEWDKRKPWGRGGGGGRPTNKELKLREIGFSLTRLLSERSAKATLPIDDLSYVLDMKVEKVPEFLNWAKYEIR